MAEHEPPSSPPGLPRRARQPSTSASAATAAHTDPPLPPAPHPLARRATRKRSHGSFLYNDSSDAACFSSDDAQPSAEVYDKPRAKRKTRGPWWVTRGSSLRRRHELGSEGDVVGEEAITAGAAVVKKGKEKSSARKREFKRNFDSGVWLGSDSSAVESVAESEMPSSPVKGTVPSWEGLKGGRLDKMIALARRDSEMELASMAMDVDEDEGIDVDGQPAPSQAKRMRFPQVEDSFVEAQRRAFDEVQRCVEEGKESVDISSLDLGRVLDSTLRPLTYLTRQPSGARPSYVELTPNIQLFLANNRVEDLPSQLFRLKNLSMLSLRSNRIHCLSPSIGRMQKLIDLNVSINFLRYLPYSLIPAIRSSRLRRLSYTLNPFIEYVERELKPGSDPDTSSSDSDCDEKNAELYESGKGGEPRLFPRFGVVAYTAPTLYNGDGRWISSTCMSPAEPSADEGEYFHPATPLPYRGKKQKATVEFTQFPNVSSGRGRRGDPCPSRIPSLLELCLRTCKPYADDILEEYGPPQERRRLRRRREEENSLQRGGPTLLPRKSFSYPSSPPAMSTGGETESELPDSIVRLLRIASDAHAADQENAFFGAPSYNLAGSGSSSASVAAVETGGADRNQAQPAPPKDDAAPSNTKRTARQPEHGSPAPFTAAIRAGGGRRLCDVCARAYVVPRGEWVEWWRGYVERAEPGAGAQAAGEVAAGAAGGHGNDGDDGEGEEIAWSGEADEAMRPPPLASITFTEPAPFLRRACSWACVWQAERGAERVGRVRPERRRCGWKEEGKDVASRVWEGHAGR